MRRQEAALRLYSYLLENYPNGATMLVSSLLTSEFNLAESEALRCIYERVGGPNDFILEFPQYFVPIYKQDVNGSVEQEIYLEEDANDNVVYAFKACTKPRSLNKHYQKERKTIITIFYTEKLQNNDFLRKKCTDKNIFKDEFSAWKDDQICQFGSKKYRGCSPSQMIRELQELNLIDAVIDGDSIIWNCDNPDTPNTTMSTTSIVRGNIKQMKANRKMTSKETIQSAAERVRLARDEMSENRNGIEVDLIDFGLEEDHACREGTSLIQNVSVRNIGQTTPVIITIQREIARQRQVHIYHGSRPSAISSAKSEKKPIAFELAIGQSVTVQVTYKPRTVGMMKTFIPFDIKSTQPSTLTPFSIARYISIRCGDPDDHAILKPVAPYQKKKIIKGNFTTIERCKNSDIKDIMGHNPYKHPLKSYGIPASLRKSVQEGDIVDKLRDLEEDTDERNKLSMKERVNKHIRKLGILLYAEEYQMEKDIKTFDMSSVTLLREGRFYSLYIPGLAENRPSVLRGDMIKILKGGRCYGGVVRYTTGESAKLQLPTTFRYINNECVDVRFSFKRTGMKLCHQALDSISSNKNHLMMSQILFPESTRDTIHPSPLREYPDPLFPHIRSSNNVTFYNRSLNEEQKHAVVCCMKAQARPSPFLIFGPPGTGKTVTLVESILNTVRNKKSDKRFRLLVCAPSNTATDLIVEKLFHHFDKTEMVRLLAFSRDKETVSEKVLKYSYTDQEGNFIIPSIETIKEKRIVTATLATAGRLPNIGVRDHFTHIFIDEAGHCTEPEAFSCLVDVAKMSGSSPPALCLAGDPLQLGPIIRNDVAKEFGLQTSLLERASKLAPYLRSDDNLDSRRDYELFDSHDSRFMVKLVKNYRSHPAILRLPNEQFYNGDLEAEADEFTKNSLQRWEHLPKKGFPIIFHGVEGQDTREGSSPSWFNEEECQLVKMYVEHLLKGTRSNRPDPEEIGIVTPYHKQAQKIRLLLCSRNYGDCKVGSVEEFQGSERRVIIISTVRSQTEYLAFDEKHKLGFLSNPKRFNVAITRAQALLIVIGNPYLLEHDEHWKSLLHYCVDNHAYVGCDYKKDVRRNRNDDKDLQSALHGIANMSMIDDDDDDVEAEDAENRISSVTAQEGPEWRNEE